MIAATVLAVLLTVEGLLLGGAKVVGTAGMRRRAAHVGFAPDAYRKIGVLELLAAAGIAVGIGIHGVGVLAAAGLILLLAGAVVAHRRAGDSVAAVVPAAVVAALAAAYIATLATGH